MLFICMSVESSGCAVEVRQGNECYLICKILVVVKGVVVILYLASKAWRVIGDTRLKGITCRRAWEGNRQRQTGESCGISLVYL